MIYRVVAPLVVVKSHGKTVYRAAGQRVDGLTDEDADRLIGRGMIAATDETAPDPETPVAGPADVAVADVEKPKKTHGLDRWQAYARSQGLTDDDIADASKADLIALVG